MVIGKEVIGFPNPVNEKAARVVAAGVAAISLLAIVTGWLWLVLLLALGFWARVVTGPKLSPLGRLAVDVVAPLLGPPRYVPGPPKRFAQGIGAALTTLAGILLVAFSATAAVTVILAIMVTVATLEAAARVCVGCAAFNALMRLGVIPREVCEECADISRRYA